MKNYHTNIYRAIITTPFGKFKFAVLSTEQDARADLYTCVESAFNMSIGLVRINEIKRSNRRIIKSMIAVNNCKYSSDGQWAWMKKVDQN